MLRLSRKREYYDAQIDEEKWFADSTPKAVLRDLDRLYRLWEAQIEKENKKSYVTDDVSNALASFSKKIVEVIFPIVTHVLNADVVTMEKLYSHRHFGYACFAVLDKEPKLPDIIENQHRINYQRLYASLARYYTVFYGSFRDNEEAIKLLCKYYVNDIFHVIPDEEEATENLVYALRRHIGNAGESTDTGYAFNGLSLVRKYAQRLDRHIILRLLNKFTPAEIRNNAVTRKQVWNIIAYSNLENKVQLKFYFLDAVQLEEYGARLLFTHKLKRQQSFFNDSWTDASHTQSHVISKNENQGKGLAEIQREPYRLRSILYRGNVFAMFYYGEEKEQPDDQLTNMVPFVEINGCSLAKEYAYDFSDHELNAINYRLYEKLDRQLSDEKDAGNRELALSYLWVDGYKELKEVELSLDGAFRHTVEQTFIRQEATPLPENFFSPHILSIFAIVGRNGQGKSRILDFLRDGMRLLLTGQRSPNELLAQKNYSNNNQRLPANFMSREEKRKVDKTWEELDDTRFVMIFRQKDEYYYYAWNMGASLNVPPDIIEFSPKANGNILESLQVVYFTNATITDEAAGTQKPVGRYWVDYSSGTVQAQQWGVVNHLRQMQMHEDTEFLNYQTEEAKKLQEDTQLANLDFLRQLYFLRFCYEQPSSTRTVFSDFQHKDLYFITTDLHGTIRDVNKLDGVQKEKIDQDRDPEDIGAVLELNRSYLLDQISSFKEISSGELHKLGYFSSGEYARLVMLSRLYWYFQGQRLCFEEQGKTLAGLFSGDEDYFGSTILLIDEGELYYHPEWQRCFLSSLLDLINACFSEDKQGGMKLQLLLTSNSPFVLTDLPKPCVKLLSTEKADIRETFSQNIYTLISDSFFLGDVTGSFATRKINEVRAWLQEVEASELAQGDRDSLGNQAVAMEDILNRIGEPVVRDALLRKYYAVTPRLERAMKDKFKQFPPEYQKDIITYIDAFLNTQKPVRKQRRMIADDQNHIE